MDEIVRGVAALMARLVVFVCAVTGAVHADAENLVWRRSYMHLSKFCTVPYIRACFHILAREYQALLQVDMSPSWASFEFSSAHISIFKCTVSESVGPGMPLSAGSYGWSAACARMH
jgi:hypothetical protein